MSAELPKPPELPDMQAFEFAGHALELHAERAVHWPSRAMLLIADLHLGKDDLFRRAGLSVPSGHTSADLARLQRLLARTGARQLAILGDVLHGALPKQAAPLLWRQQWLHFRASHPELQIYVIPGNHDRALDQAALAVSRVADPWCVDGLALRHDPEQPLALACAAAGLPVICGHRHPAVRVPGLPGSWPAMLASERVLTLPAFSRFTGGSPMPGKGSRQGSERIWVCVREQVILLPPRNQSRHAPTRR